MPSFPVVNFLKDCRHGKMLYNINDMYVGQSLDYYGEFGEPEIGFYRQLVREGDGIVEVGANIGPFTVFFARAVGQKGEVWAFEPLRLVYQLLCANIALNSFTNVYCINAALGETEGAIATPTLDPTAHINFGGLSLGGYTQGESIPLKTLDSFPISKCRLIKIDVEGMELRVLKGAVKTIDRFRPILYVENDRPQNSAELIRFIDSLGYSMYWHHPALFNPDNFFQKPGNIFGPIVSKNILCLSPEIEWIVDAPKVEVPRE